MDRSAFVRAIAVALAVPALAFGTPVLAQGNPIKVGVIGPFKLTPGRDIQEAATLATEEINARAASRPAAQLIRRDRAEPREGKTAVSACCSSTRWT
jgi:hypothetical protein